MKTHGYTVEIVRSISLEPYPFKWVLFYDNCIVKNGRSATERSALGAVRLHRQAHREGLAYGMKKFVL